MGAKVLLNTELKKFLFFSMHCALSAYSFNLMQQRCYVSDPISLSGNLVQAYEVLSKCLREIEGIPLKVSSVQSLDSGLLKFRNYKSVLALIFSVSVVSYFKFSS